MPGRFSDLLVLWVSKSQISALGIRAKQGAVESLLLAVTTVYKKLMLGSRVVRFKAWMLNLRLHFSQRFMLYIPKPSPGNPPYLAKPSP